MAPCACADGRPFHLQGKPPEAGDRKSIVS